MALEETKKKRLEYLHKVYDVSKANPFTYVSGAALAKDLGFNDNETQPIVHYLDKEKLIQTIPFTGSVAITHDGIKQVENAMENPSQPTQYFPPINVIKVDSMVNSQIQQSTTSSNQFQDNSKEIKLGNLTESKKKGYMAGIFSIIIAVIFGVMVFQFGWGTTGQIMTAISALFSILGIGSLLKPESIGILTSEFLDNIGRKYDEDDRDTRRRRRQ